MATDLLLPSGLAPTNLHLRPSVKAAYVTHDLYDIAKQMREIDPNLYAVQLEEFDDCAYAIMEHCDDGLERLVFRVPALDGRVIAKLRHLMAVPLHERMALVEAEERRSERENKANELDELYERFGGQMRHDLARCGFTEPLPESAPLRNKTAMRHRREHGAH